MWCQDYFLKFLWDKVEALTAKKHSLKAPLDCLHIQLIHQNISLPWLYVWGVNTTIKIGAERTTFADISVIHYTSAKNSWHKHQTYVKHPLLIFLSVYVTVNQPSISSNIFESYWMKCWINVLCTLPCNICHPKFREY